MTLSETIELIENADRCKFSTYGYACGKQIEHGRYLCEEHATAKCASCGQPATHGCDFCGQFVCGTPLCDECTFGTDTTKPAGAWGFINHIHISKPEYADKHENRRLKVENAALAREAETLKREIAEKDARIADLEEALKPVADKYADITPTSSDVLDGARHPDDMADDDLALITFGIAHLRRARALLGGSDAGN